MRILSLLYIVLLAFVSLGQYCPALGPDQILPCGVGTTTLTADLSQCGPGGPSPNQTTNYGVSSIPYVAQVNNGTNLFMTDDSQQGPFNIGFTFCFFGQTYTQFYIGSNGWISFSPGQPTTFTTQTLPTGNALVPKNCIMGPWQDWHPGIGGQIKYQTVGVAPCRKLIVSWIGVPMFFCTGNQGTFHIVIHESTNYIDNYIQNKPDCSQWQGGTATQGIHNVTGTIGITVPGRNSSTWTTNNDAWRWTPSGPVVNPVLTWYRVGNPNPIGTGLSINVTPLAAGSSYTCKFVYPICNAGWNTCNGVAGLGPDTVFVQPGPPIPMISPIVASDTVCFGSNSEIYSVIEQPGIWYQWSTVGTIVSGQGTDSTVIDWSSVSPGFIPGAVMVVPEANGCIGMPVTFDLTILNILPTIDPVGPFCEYDEFVTLQATPLGGVFSGPGMVGNDFIPGNAVGVDTILYEYSLSGCLFDTTTIITVYPTPTLDSITPHNAVFELCELDTANITWSAIGNPAGYNEWTWNNQQYIQNSLTQTIGWDSVGVHQVSAVHYANGCVSSPQTAFVTIIQCPELLFYIPNSFTPDGDEFNNVFRFIFTSGFDAFDFHLTIFNRWGETVFESYNHNEYWDGTYNNKPCQTGSYVYSVEFGDAKNGHKYQYAGNTSIIR